ncbi:MAG: PT domain-containing protein, partial [Alphaproteobacteria bacterium]|nr:PT domain-containing protein [Alphaproteobacteria bacterium]
MIPTDYALDRPSAGPTNRWTDQPLDRPTAGPTNRRTDQSLAGR